MAWPQWPKLPTVEFPPKELPVFLHPLRLIPHYSYRVSDALGSFLTRGDDRLFGPVEQLVTAIVIVGLALKTSTQAMTVVSDLPASLQLQDHSPHNDTLSPAQSEALSGSASHPSNPSSTGSSTLDLLFPVCRWLKQHLDLSAILVVLLAINVVILIIPRETKGRLKTSWDLFWPPWQDRSVVRSDIDSSPGPGLSANTPRDISTTSRSVTKSAMAHDQVAEMAKQRDSISIRPHLPAIAGQVEGSKSSMSEVRDRGDRQKEGERPLEISSPTPATTRSRPSAPSGSAVPSTVADAEMLAKEMDRVKREMLRLKADPGVSDSEKKRKLQALEAQRQKLKSMALRGQSDPTTPRLRPEGEDVSGTARKSGSPGVSDELKQLEKLKMKMAAIQADRSLSASEKAEKMKQYEKMRQQLKGKGRAENARSSSVVASGAPTATPRSVELSRSSADELSSEDRKRLERLRGKMASVEADTSLGSLAKAAMLAELEKKRHELKKKAGAAVLAAVVGLATSHSGSAPPPPPSPSTIDASTSAAAPVMDADQRKELERLKGKVAAIKVDPSLTEDERRAKLLVLDKAWKKLKIQQPAVIPPILAPAPPPPKPSASLTAPTIAATSVVAAADPLVPPISAPQDALMIGETSQLKSVLKKSKKKPRQKKNIHHNYFMTMRGWRPALVPFPHGLHPKPQAPRNTLWWDNVPKDADHIMATPKIAKVPEGPRAGEEGEDEKKDAPGGSANAIKEGKKVLEAFDKKTPPHDSSVGKDEKSRKSDDQSKSTSAADAAKDAERTKRKMAELEKLKSKEKAGEPNESAARAETSITKPAAVLVDPKIQKATWVAQGLLCVLLLFEQLAFVVLGFFVWKHMQEAKVLHQARPPLSDLPPPPPPPNSSASSTRTAKPTSAPVRSGSDSGSHPRQGSSDAAPARTSKSRALTPIESTRAKPVQETIDESTPSSISQEEASGKQRLTRDNPSPKHKSASSTSQAEQAPDHTAKSESKSPVKGFVGTSSAKEPTKCSSPSKIEHPSSSNSPPLPAASSDKLSKTPPDVLAKYEQRSASVQTHSRKKPVEEAIPKAHPGPANRSAKPRLDPVRSTAMTGGSSENSSEEVAIVGDASGRGGKGQEEDLLAAPLAVGSSVEHMPLNEAARKASEAAKAERRAGRMRLAAGRQGPTSSAGVSRHVNVSDGPNGVNSPEGGRYPGLDIRVDHRALGIGGGLRTPTVDRLRSGDSRPRAEELAPDISGLLVEVDNASDGLLDDDQTPKPERQYFGPGTDQLKNDGNHRVEMEKLKDERRTQLLTHKARPPPPKTQSATTLAAVTDTSPISVYSHVTDGESQRPPSPETPPNRRVAKDVTAAREALAAETKLPEGQPRLRSSSIGSFGVIRFDGESHDLTDPPRTAPILCADHYRSMETRRARNRVERVPAVADVAILKDGDRSGSAGERAAASSPKSKPDVKRETPEERVIRKETSRIGRERERNTARPEQDGGKDGKPCDTQGKSIDHAAHGDGQKKGVGHREENGRPKKGNGKEIPETRKTSDVMKRNGARPKLRLEDLTPEQVEEMQREREKRRVRKAREAKEARGEGSSGLTAEEKAGIPLSP